MPLSCTKRYLPSLGLALLLVCTATSTGAAQVVATETATIGPVVETVRINGTVSAQRASGISSPVPGLIEACLTEAGDQVAPGDLLVQLDVEAQSLALNRIRAERDQVEVELADAVRRLTEAERLGTQADIAITEVEGRRANVARFKAALAAADAAVAEQEAVVRRHSITAPFAGVVVSRSAEVGEWVNPGEPLLELVATASLWFDFQVPQSHYGRITKDTGILFTFDRQAGQPIRGTISALVPVKDPAARTFLLRAIAPPPYPHPVTPGMSVRGELLIDTGRDSVTVSRDAIIRYPDGRTTVWTLEGTSEGQVARELRVETGVEFDGRVEVVSGLDPGVTVVSRGNESLRPGQKVAVQ
ncbi:MAG: efflux RND transporter periplasmic adaptor subunit [Pseudomonadota bacterium]